MGWLATLHGDVDHLDPDHRVQAEAKVRDALQGVAGGLADDGHQGIAATFHGTTTGDVNLLEPGTTPDAGPQDYTAAPEAPEGTQAPGTAAEPSGPSEDATIV